VPIDKERGEELKSILDKELRISKSNFIELYAEFKIEEKKIEN
jgi:hypothetical protein